MENQTKASSEYTFLQQGVIAENNVLLTICGDSIDSRELLLPAGEGNDLQNMLGYRLMDKTKSECDDPKSECAFTSTLVAPKSSCDVFVIKEYASANEVAKVNKTSARNVPRLIAPKLSETNGNNTQKRKFVIESYKKRDDKKRATHNEVERRRRDKINSWIFKLKDLIPDSDVTNSPKDKKYKTSDSKSQILIRACEYIKEMQDELKSLRECLMENDNLRLSNHQLVLKMDQLKSSASQRTPQEDIKCHKATEEIREDV